MIFRITEELYVLYHKCVVVFGQLCALDSCGVEADGLVMGDAVAESFDSLEFIVNSPLSETRYLCREYL